MLPLSFLNHEVDLTGSRIEQPPKKTRRRGRTRAQAFGYRVNLDCSVRNGISDEDDSNSCLNAVVKIVKDAQIDTVACVKCPEDYSGSAFCFPITHNKSPEGLKGITKENIERLKL
jgi:hypothetical protein